MHVLKEIDVMEETARDGQQLNIKKAHLKVKMVDGQFNLSSTPLQLQRRKVSLTFN